MSFKKTLSLSLFLHLSFFAAVLLLSADLLKSSSKILNEDVIFVKFTEDMSESYKGKLVNETKESKPKVSQQARAGKNHAADIQGKTVSMKAETINEMNPLSPPNPPLTKGKQEGGEERQEELNTNTDDESVTNVSLTNYENNGDGGVADILSGSKTNNNVSDSSFSSESSGASEDKGEKALSHGILEAIRNSIEKAKTYPLLARKRGIEGTVYISFRVNSEGKPQDIRISHSSGSAILDNATLDIVKKAAPFPHIDSPVEVPVVFRLN